MKMMRAVRETDVQTILEVVVYFRKRLRLATSENLIYSEFRQLDLLRYFVELLSSFKTAKPEARPIFEELTWAFANYTIGTEYDISFLEQYGFRDIIFTIFDETDDLILFENVTRNNIVYLLHIKHGRSFAFPVRMPGQERNFQFGFICNSEKKRTGKRVTNSGAICLVD